MTNITVLGGSGFVGKSLLQKLESKKFKVKVMVNSSKIKNKFKKFHGDILDKKTFENQIKNGDIIINLVGQYNGHISNFIDLNIKGGLNLLESCKGKKNIKIILISSIDAYGENMQYASKEKDEPSPQNNYGLIKLLAEKMYENFANIHGLDVIVLRLSNLYGPNKKNGLIMNILKAIKKNGAVSINHNGKQQRDYLFIEDAVDGIIKAVQCRLKKYNVINISSGKRYRSTEIIKFAQELSHKKLKFKLKKIAPDEKCVWANNSKAKKLLKFAPKIDIKHGLNLTLKHFSL
jgi:nucleoside-diphosphate-sugar epimerase